MGHTLDGFIKKHEGIQKLIRPKIEESFKVKIKNPNLITIALFTPSTKIRLLLLEIIFKTTIQTCIIKIDLILWQDLGI